MNRTEHKPDISARWGCLLLTAFLCLAATACTPPANTTVPDPCDGGGGGGGGRQTLAPAPVSPPMAQDALRESRDAFAQRMGKE